MIEQKKLAPRCVSVFSAIAATIGLAFLLASVTAAETLQRWTLDWGGALHGQVSSGAMGDVAGSGVGLDLSLRVRPPRSRLGFRIEGAVTKHATTKTQTEGEFCLFGCYPISMTAKTSHNILRLETGPQWSMPLGKERFDLYVMVGIASVEPRTRFKTPQRGVS